LCRPKPPNDQHSQFNHQYQEQSIPQGHSFHVNGSLRQDKTNMIASSHSHYNSQDTVTEILPEASICSSKMLLI